MSDQTENSRKLLLRKSTDYQELDKLGQELENIQGFRGAGFFSVDCQIVTAMLGTFLTYLIILMQWPSLDEEAVPGQMIKIEVIKYRLTAAIIILNVVPFISFTINSISRTISFS